MSIKIFHGVITSGQSPERNTGGIFVSEKLDGVMIFSKIHVFSDGCASQFKNKKNLSRMHEEIMNSFSTVMDILHFFAGSNCFKGVHDGFGGIVKRYIARYILQDNSHAITNAVEIIDALSKKKKIGLRRRS